MLSLSKKKKRRPQIRPIQVSNYFQQNNSLSITSFGGHSQRTSSRKGWIKHDC